MFGLYVVCLFHGAYLYLHVLILSFLTRRTSCLTQLTSSREPLGEQGQEIGSRIIGFVENVKAGVLGSVGLALLIWTVVSLMQKIETAFNYIWHVAQDRPFAQRFSGYFSVLVIGPVLIFPSAGKIGRASCRERVCRYV